MIRLRTFPLDPGPEAHEALFDAMGEAADAARTLVEREEQDTDSFDAPEVDLPPIAVVDEAGRPIATVRLDRAPGTWNFWIVLAAERAA